MAGAAVVTGLPKGRFVVLEGIDGSGKTTQLEALAAWLPTSGLLPEGATVLCRREPGGTALGQALRQQRLQDHRGREAVDALEGADQQERPEHRERVVQIKPGHPPAGARPDHRQRDGQCQRIERSQRAEQSAQALRRGPHPELRQVADADPRNAERRIQQHQFHRRDQREVLAVEGGRQAARQQQEEHEPGQRAEQAPAGERDQARSKQPQRVIAAGPAARPGAHQ